MPRQRAADGGNAAGSGILNGFRRAGRTADGSVIPDGNAARYPGRRMNVRAERMLASIQVVPQRSDLCPVVYGQRSFCLSQKEDSII